MDILVSFCNLKARGCPGLGLLDTQTFEFRVLRLPDEIARASGFTGLAVSDQYVFAVAQSLAESAPGSASTLLIFDRVDLALCHRYEFRSAADVHSLCLDGSRLLGVSTGTDEIVELSLRGPQVISERVLWRPENDGSRTDRHHLNAISVSEDGILVTGFGTKAADGWTSARDGFVVEIASGRRVASGIDQPHSLARVGTKWACCESRKAIVRNLNEDEGWTSAELPGYTRGLCVIEESLFVGTSVGRRHSRSTGEINNPAEGGVPGGRCTIARLSLQTLAVEQVIDLGIYGQEIYDLLPVEGAKHWPALAEVQWRDIAIQEFVTVVDSRTTWAKQADAVSERLRSVALEQSERLRAASEANSRLNARLATAEAELEFLRGTILETLEHSPELAHLVHYRQMIMRLRQVVDECVPAQAVVVVVSKGDDEILRLGNRRASHFPQTESGEYAGAYPSCGTAAVAHLEALRVRGADYLVIPDTYLWWLDHYGELGAHLCNVREVACRHGVCRIFALNEPLAVDGAERNTSLQDVLSRCSEQGSEEPALLDWNSGLDFRGIEARCAVFSPPEPGPALPYLDRSIDLVAVPADLALAAEACRVARTAVLTTNGHPGSFDVKWLSERPRGSQPSVTVIVPSQNDASEGRLWDALSHHLPADFTGEFIADADVAVVGDRPVALRRMSRVESESPGAFFNRAAEDPADVLIFLTPCLLPLGNWVRPLGDLLCGEREPGAVAGKVFGPDGRLDAAGATLFADGSARDFGSGDFQAEDPLYEYVRSVDGCSGHMLATRRDLFAELGGFDPLFRTPTYAFADFSFRARQRGRPACYQPESRFVLVQRREPSVREQEEALDRETFRMKWQSELGSMPSARPIWDRDCWRALTVS